MSANWAKLVQQKRALGINRPCNAEELKKIAKDPTCFAGLVEKYEKDRNAAIIKNSKEGLKKKAAAEKLAAEKAKEDEAKEKAAAKEREEAEKKAAKEKADAEKKKKEEEAKNNQSK